MATDLYAGIATTLSIFACIWLFSAYSHTHPHHRSIPLQMILVLGVFDFIQSIASVLAFGSDILNEKGIHINSCFYTQTVFWFSVFFSLFWSCALAVFSAKAINAPQAISPRSKKLFYSGIFICMVFAALLIVPIVLDFQDTVGEGCTFNFSPHKLKRLLIQLSLPLLAILITVISYIKVGLVMKEVPRKILSHWMINPSYLIWYPISQLVLYVPYLVAAILPSFVVETPIYLDILWRFFIHMAGFVNSMVYLKMRREIKRSKNKVRSVAGSVTSDENDFNEILIEENAEALLSNLKSSRPSTKS